MSIFLITDGLVRKGIAYPMILMLGSNCLANPSNTIIFYNRVAILPSNWIWHFYAEMIIDYTICPILTLSNGIEDNSVKVGYNDILNCIKSSFYLSLLFVDIF